MKRKGLITVLVAVAATFGLLFATMGPWKYDHYRHNGHHHHCAPDQSEQVIEE